MQCKPRLVACCAAGLAALLPRLVACCAAGLAALLPQLSAVMPCDSAGVLCQAVDEQGLSSTMNTHFAPVYMKPPFVGCLPTDPAACRCALRPMLSRQGQMAVLPWVWRPNTMPVPAGGLRSALQLPLPHQGWACTASSEPAYPVDLLTVTPPSDQVNLSSADDSCARPCPCLSACPECSASSLLRGTTSGCCADNTGNACCT